MSAVSRVSFCVGKSLNFLSEVWKKRFIMWLQMWVYLAGSMWGSKSQMTVCEHRNEQKRSFFTRFTQASFSILQTSSIILQRECSNFTSSKGMEPIRTSSSSRNEDSLLLQKVQAFSTSPLSANLPTSAWNCWRKGVKKRMRQFLMKRKRGCLLSSKRSCSSQKLQMQQWCRLYIMSLAEYTLPYSCFPYLFYLYAQQIRMRAKCSQSFPYVKRRAILFSQLEKMIQLIFLKSTTALLLDGAETMVSLERNLLKLSLLHFSLLRIWLMVQIRFSPQRWLRSLLLALSSMSLTLLKNGSELARCQMRLMIFLGSVQLRWLVQLYQALRWDMDMKPQNELLAGLNPSLPRTRLYILQRRASTDISANDYACCYDLDLAWVEMASRKAQTWLEKEDYSWWGWLAWRKMRLRAGQEEAYLRYRGCSCGW